MTPEQRRILQVAALLCSVALLAYLYDVFAHGRPIEKDPAGASQRGQSVSGRDGPAGFVTSG